MSLHVAAIVALFADAPIQVQCIQPAAQEEAWKWWFGALTPWIGPLVSGVVSIYVAWMVFRWQGNKDRKAWIHDQKSAEWKGLLIQISEIDGEIVRFIEGTYEERKLESISQSLLASLRAINSLKSGRSLSYRFRSLRVPH